MRLYNLINFKKRKDALPSKGYRGRINWLSFVSASFRNQWNQKKVEGFQIMNIREAKRYKSKDDIENNWKT